MSYICERTDRRLDVRTYSRMQRTINSEFFQQRVGYAPALLRKGWILRARTAIMLIYIEVTGASGEFDVVAELCKLPQHHPAHRVDGDEFGGDIRPAAGIGVGDAIQGSLHGLMSVAAEDIFCAFCFGIIDCIGSDLLRNPQPGLAAVLHPAAKPLIIGIDTLEHLIKSAGNSRDHNIFI